jgi:hypothetical protein
MCTLSAGSVAVSCCMAAVTKVANMFLCASCSSGSVSAVSSDIDLTLK